MSTQISTRNPAVDPLGQPTDEHGRAPRRGWAIAGVVAGLGGIATMITSGMVDSIYAPGAAQDLDGLVVDLGTKTSTLLAFHAIATITALVLPIFAFGLFRRLTSRVQEGSTIPAIAAFGLLGTSLMLMVGTALDTEFVFAFLEGPELVVPELAALYNHWIGTVPWVWTFAGLSGVAVFAAARRGAVARWMGWTGLVLGGVSILLSVAPLQYMSGMAAPIMVLALSLGFLFGDKAHG